MESARHRQGAAPAALRWGSLATLALALVIGAVSVTDIQLARTEVDALVRTADRSTSLVGEIGRQVTRLRAAALQHVLEARGAPQAAGEDVSDIEASLDESLAALEPLLQPHERVRWDAFVPLLEQFRERLRAARRAAREGLEQRAEALLAEAAALARRMQDELDVLGELNREESEVLLEAADRRLRRVRAIHVLLDVALLLGLALIWTAVVRIIRRQDEVLAGYLGRIEQSNRDLDAFAGRIAHDLRNALAPLTFIAARLRGPQRGEAVERLAGQIDRTVRQARGLLDGLLAFSRAGHVGAGGTASAATVVHDVLEELAPLAARVDARVETAIEDVRVACAPGLLHLVAANLAGNALKFVDGRPLRDVRISVRRRPDAAELTVADTGPGISPEALPRIWEPFYRAPGVAAPGMGIGLATVRRIVDAHGGSIDVASAPGQGATFRVRLPLAPDVGRVEAGGDGA